MREGTKANLSSFNLVASALLTALGLFALSYLIPVHIPLPQGIDQGLSARFMPTLAVSAITLLALLLGGNVLLRKMRGLEPLAEDNEDNDIQGFGRREAANALLLLAGSAAYVALLQASGFVVASAAGLFVGMWFGGVRNWPILVVVCVGLPLALSEILWRSLMIIVPPFPFFG